jgi:hypothetical protein
LRSPADGQTRSSKAMSRTATMAAVTRTTSDDSDVENSGWLRNSKLALACFGIFFVLLIAQSLTGWREHDNDARAHGETGTSYPRYLTTGHFYEATFENWESEFLQMAAYVVLTVFLIQKGSAESRKKRGETVDEDPALHRDDPNAPWPVRRGGVWLTLYKNSLFLAFVLLFLASMVGHALGGTAEYNAEQAEHGDAEQISVAQFARSSEFWFQSFQNWQSEFLAVGSIVVLTIFLRQQGSAESKPVHAPTSETGSD